MNTTAIVALMLVLAGLLQIPFACTLTTPLPANCTDWGYIPNLPDHPIGRNLIICAWGENLTCSYSYIDYDDNNQLSADEAATIESCTLIPNVH